ncbi:hypothetical protein IOD16_22545 [Saccharothrix sp. 6-C]|uniref:hypothetical protein n=1 Tax=Saccharothrix sp. 6-C TaxID=2781735 RepID=UPI0019173D3A|nr:hypothetical protein IOD16_22545 [Saccharothrix sp. 6-C]
MTVRFGRTGTSGRTQVTEPVSAGAATAHVMTLLVDKRRAAAPSARRPPADHQVPTITRPDPRSAWITLSLPAGRRGTAGSHDRSRTEDAARGAAGCGQAEAVGRAAGRLCLVDGVS